MAVFDFKKEYKELYQGTGEPSILNVSPATYLIARGHGNPNTSPLYQHHVELLYGLSYAIKMSKKGDWQPEGYFDFVVPPLEGLWWFDEEEFSGEVISRKDDFRWIMMIRQPDFVNEEVLSFVKQSLERKKPELDTSVALLERIDEGLSAQILHIGPYDNEAETIARLDAFIAENGYKTAMSGYRQHREIYLSDPRRTKPEKLKTLIRQPIEKAIP